MNLHQLGEKTNGVFAEYGTYHSGKKSAAVIASEVSLVFVSLAVSLVVTAPIEVEQKRKIFNCMYDLLNELGFKRLEVDG